MSSSITGEFVSETFDNYDGGRQVTVYVPPVSPLQACQRPQSIPEVPSRGTTGIGRRR